MDRADDPIQPRISYKLRPILAMPAVFHEPNLEHLRLKETTELLGICFGGEGR